MIDDHSENYFRLFLSVFLFCLAITLLGISGVEAEKHESDGHLIFFPQPENAS